ncbi:MAG: iron-containing alcohol dehydrogenase [Myxococcota bacterium]|nr:iron-containing alcohol dehydrogenase [Myxococcota bacterium]
MAFNWEDMVGTWNYPTAIRFGAGRVAELPEACRELGIRRPLIVTDEGIAKLPMVDEILAIQEDGGVASGLFFGISGNPTGDQVDAGVQFLRDRDHDGVVALGGGSALDVGKAVALMARQSRPLWDFEDAGDNWKRADPAGMVPVVAVPTTSGTGSEVGRCSVIVNATEKRKVLIFHPGILPERVICDPLLSAGLPPALTAAVGMDALSHNLEAYCAPGFHPMADGIALEGMRLVHDFLEAAVNDGLDIAARSGMMLASTMGATAFQKGLGAMHAMSHPIGGVLGAHHGLTNAVVMPYVLKFNESVIGTKMDTLSSFLGLSKKGTTGVIDWVLGLRERLGIPHTLSDLGVKPEGIPLLAQMAVVDPTASGNPVSATQADYERLFHASLEGRV